MLASMLVSLTITPWVSSKLLKDGRGQPCAPDVTADPHLPRLQRSWRRFLDSRRKAGAMLWVTAGLFGLSLADGPWARCR
jgi:multidrug efflux pump subunit AcrB